MDLTEKIDVLKSISAKFNRAGITWSLGASMLLYFKGITTTVNDIDILVADENVEQVKAIMKALKGELQPSIPNDKYKSKAFLQYVVSGVEIDIIAGFAIVNDGKIYDCSLLPNQIVEYLDLDGKKIPLQSVDLWCKYYELMGRDEKVQLIKKVKF
ncbi:MAG: hypothetical protein PUD43_09955 [Clostridia bacterium]|nr:hypothetical protein [Clostridia bacterium]